MDTKALLTMAGIGIVAGWLASFIVGGGGLITYLVSGLLGSFVGGYLMSKLDINLGITNPLVAQIVTSTIGAIVVVIIARIIV